MSEIFEAKTRLAVHHQTESVEFDEGESMKPEKSPEQKDQWQAAFGIGSQVGVAMLAGYRVEVATNLVGLLSGGEFFKLSPRPPEPCWTEHDYHSAEAIALADHVATIMSGAGDKPLNDLTLQELAENDDVNAQLFLGYIEGRIPRARSRYVKWAVEQTLCSIVEIYGAAVQITDSLTERGKLKEDELQTIFKDCPRLSENKWDRHLWQELRTGLARFEQLNGPLRV